MELQILFFGLIVLILFAIVDLMVGVSNDAVNFLNSSIGSQVASIKVIMIIAGLGIMAGVTFSSGMMEVARKGIFHPTLFTMPQLMAIFLAVMITDVILLDIFNTFGLPTSTTVSVVFELLGAAVAVSIIKIYQTGDSLITLSEYINSGKALVIIFGILLSVIVAFIFGSIVQFFSRLLFTFDYEKRIQRYGALWGGVAMAAITFFILVKGAKGSSFLSKTDVAWIKSSAVMLLLAIFAVSALILQILIFLKVNILKPIVLIGTFALAMAFAANDLVNFIGVPLAGWHSYEAAIASDSPLLVSMEALSKKVPSQTYILLIAGAIMVITLILSRKARSVTETELSLSQQEEGVERFGSFYLARVIVRMAIGIIESFKRFIPLSIQKSVGKRFEVIKHNVEEDKENPPPFDLVRASVNLMVASGLISYATSYKLPLSTTYITFMVAMGSSFADRAWGRESAVYRISGVLAVIGGWFVTAIMAFTIAALFACAIIYSNSYAVLVLPLITGLIIWKLHNKHKERTKTKERKNIFNLKKIQERSHAVSVTFEHMSYLLHEIRISLNNAFDALFAQNEYALNKEKKKAKDIQLWVNIIIANIFKVMRLLEKEEIQLSHKYGQTIRRLQKLADGHRDIVMRSSLHVSNHHAGLLDTQIEELKEVKKYILEIISDTESVFRKEQPSICEALIKKNNQLRNLADKLSQNQVERIADGSSKTRLTILYYSIVGNAIMLSKQNLKLIEIFEECNEEIKKCED